MPFSAAYAYGFDYGYNGEDHNSPYPQDSKENQEYDRGYNDGSELLFLDDIYDEGYNAYLEGEENNPYPQDSKQAHSWDIGYNDARNEYKAK